jgi:hypothetical protein
MTTFQQLRIRREADDERIIVKDLEKAVVQLSHRLRKATKQLQPELVARPRFEPNTF